jgi:hypothetical protein
MDCNYVLSFEEPLSTCIESSNLSLLSRPSRHDFFVDLQERAAYRNSASANAAASRPKTPRQQCAQQISYPLPNKLCPDRVVTRFLLGVKLHIQISKTCLCPQAAGCHLFSSAIPLLWGCSETTPSMGALECSCGLLSGRLGVS